MRSSSSRYTGSPRRRQVRSTRTPSARWPTSLSPSPDRVIEVGPRDGGIGTDDEYACAGPRPSQHCMARTHLRIDLERGGGAWIAPVAAVRTPDAAIGPQVSRVRLRALVQGDRRPECGFVGRRGAAGGVCETAGRPGSSADEAGTRGNAVVIDIHGVCRALSRRVIRKVRAHGARVRRRLVRGASRDRRHRKGEAKRRNGSGGPLPRTSAHFCGATGNGWAIRPAPSSRTTRANFQPTALRRRQRSLSSFGVFGSCLELYQTTRRTLVSTLASFGGHAPCPILQSSPRG